MLSNLYEIVPIEPPDDWDGLPGFYGFGLSDAGFSEEDFIFEWYALKPLKKRGPRSWARIPLKPEKQYPFLPIMRPRMMRLTGKPAAGPSPPVRSIFATQNGQLPPFKPDNQAAYEP